METNKEIIKQSVYELISCHDRDFDSTEDLVSKIENIYMGLLKLHLSKQVEVIAEGYWNKNAEYCIPNKEYIIQASKDYIESLK